MAPDEDEPPPMRILDHLRELKKRLKWVAITILLLLVFFAGFQARTADVGGVQVPYPYPDPLQPFASQFFNLTLQYLKPDYVESVVLGPADAIIVQLKTAFFLALIVGMPMITYELALFIGPGLKRTEKETMLRLVAPSTILFISGVLVAFFLILPFTFDFLYQIAVNIGVDRPQIRLDEFLDFVLLFSIGFGLAFQVPVVMYALNAVGLVRARTYKEYWRWALIGMLTFGAVITPDGSGITMFLVALPMAFLYIGGYIASVIHERRDPDRYPPPEAEVEDEWDEETPEGQEDGP